MAGLVQTSYHRAQKSGSPALQKKIAVLKANYIPNIYQRDVKENGSVFCEYLYVLAHYVRGICLDVLWELPPPSERGVYNLRPVPVGGGT